MRVTCQKCGRALNVPETAIGKTVSCPACRSPVKIEEKLELAPEPPPPEAGPPVAPDKPRTPVPYTAPGMCPTCGFPVARGVRFCNRCGTDLETGQRDERAIGYRPSLIKILFGKTNWLFTCAVTIAIGVGLWYLIAHLRRWGKEAMEEGPSPVPTAPQESSTSAEKPRPAQEPLKPSPPPVQASQVPKESKSSPQQPAPAPAPAPSPVADMTSRFEEAFALLADPLPATQTEGIKKLLSIGSPAVELLGKRYTESKDSPPARAACVRGLSAFRTPEAASHLAAALADPEERIREAAISGLSAIGRNAADAVKEALNSNQPRVRAAATRVAGLLSLKDAAKTVAKLMLSDEETEVRFEAARALGGALGGPEVFEPLVTAMKDQNLDVAAAAAEALAAHVDSAEIVAKSLPSIAETGTEPLAFAAIPILAFKRAEPAEALAKTLCASKPVPKIVEACEKILALPNPASRKDAISSAPDGPEVRSAVGMCILDPDDRIRRAALMRLSSAKQLESFLPMVLALGSQDVEFALECARFLEGRTDHNLLSLLRRSAKGVHPQRKTLASGLLASRGESVGAEVLLGAAQGRFQLRSPLAGWAAYRYALVAEADKVRALIVSASDTKDARERVFFAAAGARHGDEDSLKRLRAIVSDRSAGEARSEAVRMLGELKDKNSAQVIAALLNEHDPVLVGAAARAIAMLSANDVLPLLIKRLGELPPGPAQEAAAAVLSFGPKAEDAIVAAMDDPDPNVRQAAVSLLEGLGRKATRKGIEKTVFLLRDRRLEAATREAAIRALTAMTGVQPGENWTWKQWAKADRKSVV